MSSFIFKAQKRDDFGTSHSRRLRKKGFIPAIVYANKKEPIGISLDGNNVANLINNEAVFSSIVEVELGEQKLPTLIKAIQYHPAKGNVTHVDFFLVDTSVEITTSIPFHFVGEEDCVGVKMGGVFVVHTFNIEISCLPNDLPEFIEINISNLNIEDQIYLSSISAPKGVEFVDLHKGEESVDHLICSVDVMREIVEEDDDLAEQTDADEEANDSKDSKEAEEDK